MKEKTLVITPTYNESKTIAPLINAIHHSLPEADILVVDDNSPDGCGDLVTKLMKSDKKVHIIKREKKKGIGSAYLEGFSFALEKGYDYIFEMDADLSHDPSYLPFFVEAINDADLVLGARYVPGGGVKNWGFFRRLISMGGNLYARIILGVPYRDLTSGYKLFRKNALRVASIKGVSSEGYSFQIETTYRIYKEGLRVTEIPIQFVDRIHGKSKMSWSIFFEAIIKVWSLRFFN